jgi:hypothetical protein
MRLLRAVGRRDLGPERQVVAVVVAVVLVAAVLDDEAPRVRAVAAGVPAERPAILREFAKEARAFAMCSRSRASGSDW